MTAHISSAIFTCCVQFVTFTSMYSHQTNRTLSHALVTEICVLLLHDVITKLLASLSHDGCQHHWKSTCDTNDNDCFLLSLVVQDSTGIVTFGPTVALHSE